MLLANNNALIPMAEVTLDGAFAWPTSNSDSMYTEAEHTADVDNVRTILRTTTAALADKVRKAWSSRRSLRLNRVAAEFGSVTVTEPLASMIFAEVSDLGTRELTRRKCYSANNLRNFCYVASEAVAGVAIVTPASQALGLSYQLQAYLKGRDPATLNATDKEQYDSMAEALNNNLAKYGAAWLDVQDVVVMHGDYMYVPRSVSAAVIAQATGVETLSYAEVCTEIDGLASVIATAMERATAHAGAFLALTMEQLETEDLLLNDVTQLPWIKVNTAGQMMITLGAKETQLLRTAPHLMRGIIPDIINRTEGQNAMTNLQWANAMYYYARGLARLAGLDPAADATAVATGLTVKSLADYYHICELGQPTAEAVAIFTAMSKGNMRLSNVEAPATTEELIRQRLAMWWLTDHGSFEQDLPSGMYFSLSYNDAVISAAVWDVIDENTHPLLAELIIEGVYCDPSDDGPATTSFYLARGMLRDLDARIALLHAAAGQSGEAKTVVENDEVTLIAPGSIRQILQSQYANLVASDATFVSPFMAA